MTFPSRTIQPEHPPRSTRTLRSYALAVVLAFALLASACGDDDDTSAADTSTADTDTSTTDTGTTGTTDTDTDSGPVGSDSTDPADDGEAGEDEPADDDPAEDDPAEDDPAEDEPAATDSGTAASCTEPAPGAYIVTNIAANDPDGGLVLHESPGSSAPELGVVPADYGLFITGNCVVVDDGGVWWEASEEGFPLWVNSAFVGKYDGIGDRVALGRDNLCASYQHVIDASETDIPITAQLIAIDVELGGQPVGVTAAIDALVNGTAVGGEIDSIVGYVGPICTDVTLSSAEIADLQIFCVYRGDIDSCNMLEAAGLTADTNFGLGNSLSMTPYQFLSEDCAVGIPLACEHLYFTVESVVNDNGFGSTEQLQLCGKILLKISQFTPDVIDFELMNMLLGPDQTTPGLQDDLGTLQNQENQVVLDSVIADIMPICGDFMFND